LGFLGSLFSSSVFLLLRGLLERDGFYYGHQGLFYSVFLLLGCWFFLGLLSKYERSLEIGVLCFVLSNNLIYIQWFIASVVPSKGKDWSFFCLVYRLILVVFVRGLLIFLSVCWVKHEKLGICCFISWSFYNNLGLYIVM
jgi:hypothetical protein